MLEPVNERQQAQPTPDHGYQALLDDLTRMQFAGDAAAAGARVDPLLVEREIQAENLEALLAMADGYPEGWHRLRGYLLHASQRQAMPLADVQYAQDAVASHAERCYFGGAAKLLAAVALQLDPERMRARLHRLRTREPMRTTTDDRAR